MKITKKILLYILTASLVLFTLSLGFISINFREVTKTNAFKIVAQEAKITANTFKASLDVDLSLTRTLALVFQDYKELPYEVRMEVYDNLQRNLLLEHENVVKVVSNWEFGKFDPMFAGRTDRFVNMFYRHKGKIRSIEQQLSADTASLYYKQKESQEEKLVPQQIKFDKADKAILVGSFSSPIMYKNEFVGLTEIDISLNSFAEKINKIKPFDGAQVFMLSNDARFVAHTQAEFNFKFADTYFKNPNTLLRLKNHVERGKEIAFEYGLQTEQEITTYYTFVAPIQLSGMTRPWAIGIAVPIDEVLKEANSNFYIAIIIGFASMLAISLTTWYHARRIVLPLRNTTTVVNQLALGAIGDIEPLEINSMDEIGQIRKSINILIKAFKRTTNFASEIGQGNYNAKYKKLSDKDMLGKALLEMRESLRRAEEEENERQIEDLKVRWKTEGLAKFGEILRTDQEDINKLANNLISNLVKHLKAVQGGFFTYITEEENEHIELTAFYALEGELLAKKHFAPGEGVVGEVIQNNKTLHMDNVPNSYVNVVSGLGRANPREMLVVPISNDKGIYGALEIASFKKVEKHHIEFMERLCESIAGTLETIHSNWQTMRLLEESRLQKDQLELHEQQLIENIKKMEDVQQSTAKREAELHSILRALHSIVPVAEYDMKGQIIFANKILLDLLEIKMENLLGRNQGAMRQDSPTEDFKSFWKDLNEGKAKRDIQYFQLPSGKELWLEEDYTPILDENGKPYKVLNIAKDISARMNLERKLNEQNGE